MKGKRPRIAVVGSSNSDLVVRAPRLPKPGETVLGGEFAWYAGGKGANQAVAAARLGADVTFVARVGHDIFGERALAAYQAERIDTSFVVRDSTVPSGVALVGIDSQTGENSILVAPGANSLLSVQDVEAARQALWDADVVLCQLETPLETVAAALSIGKAAGAITILNPAPAARLHQAILRDVTILTPNESEAALLAGPGARGPYEQANTLRELGVSAAVITLGAAGSFVSSPIEQIAIAAATTHNVVDTTAAGDCFTAALAVALSEGQSLSGAARFASCAASVSVERSGAQPSLPTRAEVNQRFDSLNKVL